MSISLPTFLRLCFRAAEISTLLLVTALSSFFLILFLTVSVAGFCCHSAVFVHCAVKLNE